mmetsp:Transcript_5184/g.9947  ORF Transcript_5184/g.9947 Transcript_5184/m.9947 type:complete len:480 (-) Transcript_5184:203-1642(-)
MKIIPNLKHNDGNESQAGLLVDFLDSSSDDEGSFAWGDEDEIRETTDKYGKEGHLRTSLSSTKKCEEEGHFRASLSSTKSTVPPSDSQPSQPSGIVGNLRNSFIKAKQSSVRQLQKQCSKRSIFSGSSHDKLNDGSEQLDAPRVGELANREILVKERKAVNRENEDLDFVREVVDLKRNLERQSSQKMLMKTKKEHDESTLTSRSHHTDKQISDYSADHMKAWAGRGRGHRETTYTRPKLSRSRSDPSDIEQMVFGSLHAKDTVGGTNELVYEPSIPRGRRSTRRHHSANNQDLLEMMGGNQAQFKCESSQTSDLTCDWDLDGVAKETSFKSSMRVVPLSIACETKKCCEMRSSFSTSTTEGILSETSDIEEDKSAPSLSKNESSHRASSEREGKRDLDHRRSNRRKDRPSCLHSTEPVELPYFSSHKSKNADQAGQEEVLVFKIDEDRPLIRSKHRGTKEFIQLNISNHTLESQIKAC